MLPLPLPPAPAHIIYGTSWTLFKGQRWAAAAWLGAEFYALSPVYTHYYTIYYLEVLSS